MFKKPPQTDEVYITANPDYNDQRSTLFTRHFIEPPMHLCVKRHSHFLGFDLGNILYDQQFDLFGTFQEAKEDLCRDINLRRNYSFPISDKDAMAVGLAAKASLYETWFDKEIYAEFDSATQNVDIAHLSKTDADEQSTFYELLQLSKAMAGEILTDQRVATLAEYIKTTGARALKAA